MLRETAEGKDHKCKNNTFLIQEDMNDNMKNNWMGSEKRI
jgi:hypothetical protein